MLHKKDYPNLPKRLSKHIQCLQAKAKKTEVMFTGGGTLLVILCPYSLAPLEGVRAYKSIKKLFLGGHEMNLR